MSEDGEIRTPALAEDDVDRLVRAWQRERPELDVAPMLVLSRVSRLAQHLDADRRAAFRAHGLATWEFDVLAALRRAGPQSRLSASELFRETLVTSGTMTNRIDRLASRALVTRETDPADRRVVRVRLTEEGRARVDAAIEDLLVAERRILARLPAGREDVLASALRTLLLPYDATGG